jgi:hypothetical protein
MTDNKYNDSKGENWSKNWDRIKWKKTLIDLIMEWVRKRRKEKEIEQPMYGLPKDFDRQYEE